MMCSWQAGLLQGCGSVHEVIGVRFLIMCSNQGREEESVHELGPSSREMKFCLFLWKEDSDTAHIKAWSHNPPGLIRRS